MPLMFDMPLEELKTYQGRNPRQDLDRLSPVKALQLGCNSWTEGVTDGHVNTSMFTNLKRVCLGQANDRYCVVFG